MYYTVYISKMATGSKMIQFPIPLEELPKIKNGQTTDSFIDFYGNEFTFITGIKPKEFSINLWIPKEGVKYPFQVVKNPNKSDYLSVLNWAIDKREPINLVICNSSGAVMVQGLFSIDFEESRNKFGDTTISIDCKAWRDYTK